MKRLLALFQVGLLAFAPVAARGQKSGSGVARARVVLVSVDGGADWIVDDLLARGVLPADGAFARMARRGVRAESVETINVASTAPSHAALFTGAYPERTGIVTTSFLQRGEGLDVPFGPGFTAPLKAETIWSAAMRQGKRVVCSAAVGADARSPARTCTETRGFRKLEAPASVVRLQPANSAAIPGVGFEHARALNAKGDSPGQLTYRMSDGRVVNLYAYASDSARDGVERYDGVLLDLDRTLENGYAAELKPGRWAALRLPSSGETQAGSWVQLTRISGDLSDVEVYLGSVGSNPGTPREFLRDIDAKFGFPPGEGDSQSLNRGLITERMYLEQFERAAEYEKNVVLEHLKRDDWDLLLAYLSITDHIQHRFLVRDRRQNDYALEGGRRRVRYARYVEESYRKVDAVLKTWMEAAPRGTNFVVVSDHGFVSAHHTVLVNNYLAQSGFKVAPTSEAEVRALADGASSNIYVNVRGRQKDGIVPPERLNEYVERIMKACRALRDPSTGEPVFEVVMRKDELKTLRLEDDERSPDVFVSARRGWSTSARINPRVPPIVPSTMTLEGRAALAPDARDFLASGSLNETSPGVHGYLAGERQLESIFYAAGPGVPRARLGRIKVVDIAPTVAALLNIDPPRDAQGRALWRTRGARVLRRVRRGR
ncbi:MAG TPA: alkaline phosphatase family protein [Pyrinomonadaceae bacterium]|nr:alkaline phosphatase family protein [Pyrinomonadaceae bacterium]